MIPTRRAVAGVAAALLCGVAVGALAVPAAAARMQQSPVSSLSVTITGLTPVSPTAHSTLVLTGVVANHTSAALPGLHAALLVGQPLSDASQLVSAAVAQDGFQATPATVTLPGRLGAHHAAHFRITVKLADAPVLSTTNFHVYPLEVELTSASGSSLGQALTYLPYGYQPASRLRLVTMWPLQTTPGLAGPPGTLAGSAVLAQIARGGRLSRLLTAGADSALAPKLTWAVDPELLQSVATLAHPYRVLGASGTFPATSEAAPFLATLSHAATTSGDLLALPYADPDLVAVQRGGLGADISAARHLGEAITRSVLHVAPQTDVVAPVNGDIDRPTLVTLRGDGVRAVLLSQAQLPTSPSANPSTTSAPASLPSAVGRIGGLAIDTDLANLVSAGGRDAASPRMAEQLVLAYTALVVSEQPNDPNSRDMVLSPPRDWDPESGYAADLLSGIAQARWLDPVTLRAILADPDGQHEPLQPYPAAARATELPASELVGPGASVYQLEQAIRSITDMYGTPTPTASLAQSLLAAESAEWRPDRDPAGGVALRDQIRAAVTSILASVRVAASTSVTLTSRNATVPVTIGDGLPHTVTVKLSVIQTDPTKLSAPGPLIRVQPGEKLQVRLPVHTQRSGTFTIQLELTTPDGRALGPGGAALTVTVNSRNFGTITIAITAAALGVLVISLLVRLVRRLRRRPAAPGPATS